MSDNRKLIALAVGLLAVTLLISCFGLAASSVVSRSMVRRFVVPSAGMSPTIEPGDRILVSVGKTVRRGEIAVVTNPVKRPAPIVKRIVAVGGDTVDIKDGKLWVNGKPLEEPYVKGQTEAGSEPLPLVVPAGSIYVLGDNRSNSGDSRYFGPVPESSILGRVIAIYWPPSRVRTF